MTGSLVYRSRPGRCESAVVRVQRGYERLTGEDFFVRPFFRIVTLWIMFGCGAMFMMLVAGIFIGKLELGVNVSWVMALLGAKIVMDLAWHRVERA